LQGNTEGWPVGLRLAALALQNNSDIERFISQVDLQTRPLHDYLVEEVLSRQPVEVQDCLLRISILDRFNASLCEALWNDDPGDEANRISGEDFIDLLEHSDLFTIALDERRYWFRFHHLFGDLLQNQFEHTMSSKQIIALHLKASSWYAENGYFEEALQHSIAGRNIDGASAG